MTRIYVPRDSSALALGADKLAAAIASEAAQRGIAVELIRNGSRGLLYLEHQAPNAFAPARVSLLSVLASQSAIALENARHRHTVFRLLGSIVPSQRWGVGRVRPHGWALYFKGGWGSGTGWVDHQVALLRRGHERVALAILTHLDGSHAYGKATLKGLARRLLRGLGRHTRVR